MSDRLQCILARLGVDSRRHCASIVAGGAVRVDGRVVREPGFRVEHPETAVIEDFYRGSNDSAFVRAILQKAPTTSEELFREADLYITADERA